MAKAKKTETKEEQEEKENQEIASKSAKETIEKPVKKTKAKKAGKEEEKPEEKTEKKKKKAEKEAEEKKAEKEANEEAEEEEKEFRLYTIPLRDAFNVPKSRRASKAIKIIKGFLEKHTKSEVKLTGPLNEAIWARGIKKPPRRIRVKVTEKGEIKIAKLAE